MGETHRFREVMSTTNSYTDMEAGIGIGEDGAPEEVRALGHSRVTAGSDE